MVVADVADQDDGAVANTDGAVGVDAGNDLGDLGWSQRVGLAARRDTHHPAQSPPHAPYDDVIGDLGDVEWSV